jgi:hypothetical protein
MYFEEMDLGPYCCCKLKRREEKRERGREKNRLNFCYCEFMNKISLEKHEPISLVSNFENIFDTSYVISPKNHDNNNSENHGSELQSIAIYNSSVYRNRCLMKK